MCHFLVHPGDPAFNVNHEENGIGFVDGQLNLPVDDTTYVVTFDDWMYLLDEDRMVNRSVMKKFGVRLGEVILFPKR